MRYPPLLKKSVLRKHLTTRGTLVLFIFLFCYLFFIQQQKEKIISREGIEEQLYGEEVPTIVSWISKSAVEISANTVSDCSEPRLIHEPFVVRGLAEGWPALQRWDFDWVKNTNVMADVLVSSSLKFTFYNLEKGEELMQTQGTSVLPAVMTQMTTSEATQRMTTGSRFENLFYVNEEHGKEYYYFRFDINREMESDLRLTEGLLQCWPQGKAPRLWVSVKGSVSPMHWDGHYSCLVQIRGIKRMLFYGPENINIMGTYPPSHLMWRRAKFDPANPDYEYFPEAKDVGGISAILHPGDAVCFPQRWLHYTDSLTHSISLSLRYEN